MTSENEKICPGELIDIRAAAHRLGVSRSLLRKLKRTGGGPRCFKLGRCVRYRIEDLEEWLETRAVQPKGTGGQTGAIFGNRGSDEQ
jgi:predicted DNA-binding transcriptional regulator AlpA